MSPRASMLEAIRGSALWQLSRTRMLGFLREPEAVFWVFVFPILLALALGIAFRNQGPRPVAVGVEAGQCADLIADTLNVTGRFQARVLSPADAEKALRRGTVDVLVRPAEGVPILIYDPTRPEGRAAYLATLDGIERAAGRKDVLHMTSDTRTRPGSRYIDFLIPGLIGLNLLGTGMWGIGFPIATSRQQKLLKRMLATPMRRTDYLLSFLFARLVWLLLEMAALLLFARFAFGIHVRGSWTGFLALTLVGAVAFSALGLLVASRARTIEAVSGLMNVSMLPMWLLSGTFFSAERFPAALQPFVQALPLTAVNNGLRAVMNEGAGLAGVATPLAIVAAWGVASFLAALKIFRWE